MMGLTISGLPRAAACPGSAALPQANPASDDATDGQSNHRAAELAVTGGQLERLPAELQALFVPGALASVELAVAYDIASDTARELRGVSDRGYTTATPPLGPDEIAGTIDLEIISPGRLVVVDYKYWGEVDDPDENAQVMAYAIASARIHGMRDVTVVIAHIEADDEGNVRLLRPLIVREVDEIDLDAYAARLRSIVAAVRAQQARRVPDVRENKHCKLCAAMVHCPAKRELLVRITGGQERDELEAMMPLTPATVAVAYERFKHAEHLLKRIRGAIYAFASEHDVPLGNGRVLGARTKPGNEQLDGDTVHAVVEKLYGRDVADRAIVREATKTKLEATLKASGVKPLAPAMREVLKQVAQLGGSRRDPKATVDEHPAQLRDKAS